MLIQLALNGLVVGSLYAIVTLGFSLILSVTKIWHFAHGALFTIAAYCIWLVNTRLQMPLWLGFLVAILVASLVVLLVEKVVYDTLRKKRAPSLIFFVSSLITSALLQNLLTLIFTTDAKSYPAASAQGSGIVIGTATLPWLDMVSVLTSLGLAGLFLILYRYSAWGQMMKATSENPDMAEIIGIPVKRIYRLAFIVGTLLAIPAAYLVSVHQGITPTSGFDILLIAVTASVVGGLGKVSGAILGAYVVGFLESFGVWKISSDWQTAIVFGLLFFVIILKPNGLLVKGA